MCIKNKDFWMHFVAAVAALSSIATLITFLFNWSVDGTSCFWSVFGVIVICFLCLGYASLMVRRKKRIHLELNLTLTVDVEFGDVLSKEGIIVIPVNEYFDTKVDNVVIEENSIHGQFVKKIFDGQVNDVDKMISNSLDSQSPAVRGKKNEKRQSEGKKVKYPLGTCVDICRGENLYVLFAFTHFDGNKARIDPGEVNDVIVKLIRHLDTIANGRPVYIPVFGTGQSRLQKKPQRMLIYILECIQFVKDITIPGGLHIIGKNAEGYNLNDIERFFKDNILVG